MFVSVPAPGVLLQRLFHGPLNPSIVFKGILSEMEKQAIGEAITGALLKQEYVP